MEKFNEILTEFTKMHDEFIHDWNQAMTTGDTTLVERMADDYYVAFFQGTSEQPVIYNRNDAIAGMKHSVEQLLGARKKFENRIIRLKNRDHAAVFFEQIIEKDEQVVARLFTIENWQYLNGKWMIIREMEEPIN